MFLSRNNKNNVYPYKTQFYYIEVGVLGGKKYTGNCFRDDLGTCYKVYGGEPESNCTVDLYHSLG